jgi:hypothetical protein
MLISIVIHCTAVFVMPRLTYQATSYMIFMPTGLANNLSVVLFFRSKYNQQFIFRPLCNRGILQKQSSKYLIGCFLLCLLLLAAVKNRLKSLSQVKCLRQKKKFRYYTGRPGKKDKYLPHTDGQV